MANSYNQENNSMENFIKLIEQCTQNNATNQLRTNLKLVQEILNLIFDQIKKTGTEEEATTAFALLENVQFVLAKAAFKEKTLLTTALNKFTTDFDRIDDNDVKAFLYQEIKSGKYAL